MNDETHESAWLYGVIPAGATLDELKRRDLLPDVRVIEAGDLAAIVGDAPGDDPKDLRDQALAHARVLEAAVVDAPVVPFRFGTILTEGAAGSELLGPLHDELAQILESVKDRVQLTLKANYHEDVVLRELVEIHPEIARLRRQTRERDDVATRDARLRLGELVSMALEELRRHDADTILARLTPAAVASTVAPLESEFMALNAAFLVERGRMRQFEEAAAAVAEGLAERMRLTLLGPMPAFDFIGEMRLPWA
jgi:hypothetical protein